MRKSFLLYLFVFTALLAVFMYVSGQRMLHSKDEEIEDLREELEVSNQNIDSLNAEISAEQGGPFSFESNEEALTYLENRGFDPSEVRQQVEDAIISRNKADADNDLIPYAGMEGYFRINKVKLLNHKWAVATFTDGTYWGDIFISYEINGNNLELNTEKAVLYPKD